MEILPSSQEFLAEGDAVERVEYGLAVPLDDASELRAPGLGAGEACHRFRRAKLGGMAGSRRVDVLDSAGEFAFVAVVGATLCGAAIGEHTPRYGAVLQVEGQYPAVSEIGLDDRRIAITELGEAGLGIGVDVGLPIDPANPFQRAHKEGVPRAAKPKTIGFELGLSLFSGNLNVRAFPDHVEPRDRQGTAQNQGVGTCRNRKSRATFSGRAPIAAPQELVREPNSTQGGRKAGSTCC
jgi:hypothetical protein